MRRNRWIHACVSHTKDYEPHGICTIVLHRELTVICARIHKGRHNTLACEYCIVRLGTLCLRGVCSAASGQCECSGASVCYALRPRLILAACTTLSTHAQLRKERVEKYVWAYRLRHSSKAGCCELRTKAIRNRTLVLCVLLRRYCIVAARGEVQHSLRSHRNTLFYLCFLIR